MRLLVIALLALVACGHDLPAPAVGHPAQIHGSVFALAAIDDQRAAIVHGDKAGPLQLSLWSGAAVAWSLTLPCARDDLRPDSRPGRRFVALAAGPDVVAVLCPERDGRVVRTTAFRTADGGRAWLGAARDVDPAYMSDLRALRIGSTIVGYDNRTLVAYAAATGDVAMTVALASNPRRWSSQPLLAFESLDADYRRTVSVLDGVTGAIRFHAPGIVQCLLPDGLVVIHKNDYLRLDLAGKPAALRPDDPFAARGVDSCSVHGDRTIVGSDIEAGVEITDGTPGRSLVIPHASTGGFLRGWDRPLPRYVPIATYRDQVAIVDLDAMQIARELRFDVSAPHVSAFAPQIAGRVGDVFLGTSQIGLFGVDGTTGRVVAVRGAPLVYDYWLDFAEACLGPALLVARADAAGALTIGPAELAADVELAQLIEARAAPAEP